MSVRSIYAYAFGAEQADAVEAAAAKHKNGVHDDPGSDPFRWALAICLGYECLSKDSYREHHGITVPWDVLRPWIRNHGDLANHDGDVDYLTLFTGGYDYFAGRDEVPA